MYPRSLTLAAAFLLALAAPAVAGNQSSNSSSNCSNGRCTYVQTYSVSDDDDDRRRGRRGYSRHHDRDADDRGRGRYSRQRDRDDDRGRRGNLSRYERQWRGDNRNFGGYGSSYPDYRWQNFYGYGHR
jgi:hypothetical protein